MDNDKILSRIDYLARALIAPRIRDNAQALAPRALAESWTGPQYLEAVLSAEVAAREASGARIRIRSAGFPAMKTITDFNFDHQPDAEPGQIHRLAAGGYLTEHRSIIALGPPGTGKTHLAIALGIQAATTGTRVAFDTAVGWLNRLQAAHAVGRLDAELRKVDRHGLIVIDEVGYLHHPMAGSTAGQDSGQAWSRPSGYACLRGTIDARRRELRPRPRVRPHPAAILRLRHSSGPVRA